MRFPALPLCLLLALPASAFAATPLHPDTVCNAAGQAIDEEGYMMVGGIAQWVQVKGASCANPVIVHVHGGPGNPETPYTDATYADWLKDYTIVQWDQRGAGMTYARNRPAEDEPLSVERLRDDGIEVAQWAARRFGRRQVILMGSSWGSALAVRMAKASPQAFCAYVGTAQVVHVFRDRGNYDAVLGLARAAGDTESVAKVEALGPPPWTNPRNPGILRRVMRKYEALSTDPMPAAWAEPAAPYRSAQYEADYMAGEDYSWLQFVGLHGDGIAVHLDAYALGPRFDLPVYIVQGTQDLLTMPSMTKPWYDSLEAPRKDYILVPRAGHDPNRLLLAAQYKVLKDDVGACR